MSGALRGRVAGGQERLSPANRAAERVMAVANLRSSCGAICPSVARQEAPRTILGIIGRPHSETLHGDKRKPTLPVCSLVALCPRTSSPTLKRNPSAESSRLRQRLDFHALSSSRPSQTLNWRS